MARPRSRSAELKAAIGAAFVVRALAKGLSILALFDAENREWTLDEIAERAGLPRMTAYRMIRTMESAWFLVRDPVTNRYHLGPALLASTYLSEGYAELVEDRPSLPGGTGGEDRRGGHPGHRGRRRGRERRHGRHPPAVQARGGRGTHHRRHGQRQRQDLRGLQVRRGTGRTPGLPRTRLTPTTITEPEALARELERVSQEGIAFDIEERNLGTCAVAAPVRDQMGKVIAAVSLVVPTGRFGSPERERHAEAVKETAAALSAFLGYSSRGE